MMRNVIRNALAICGLALALAVQAQSPAAMVLNVGGDASLELLGKPVRLEAMTRLLAGDRLRLARDASVDLVYPASGRKEHWTGAGTVTAGNGESTGSPGLKLEVGQLPTKVAQQIARTPTSDTSGKAGMVRMRSLPQSGGVEALETQYAKLRAEAAANDRSPEIFFLAGLNELGEKQRLRDELAKLQAAYPDDATVLTLARIYTPLLNAPSR